MTLTHVVKDLPTQAGDRPASPSRVRYCGTGNVAACRTLRYANRPSGTQQVLSFRGHRPRP